MPCPCLGQALALALGLPRPLLLGLLFSVGSDLSLFCIFSFLAIIIISSH